MVKKISRIAVGVEYDGTVYKGFQKQKSTSETIQGFIDKALSQVANQKIKTICSGRTDAGVHAYCQTIHFDTTSYKKVKSQVRKKLTTLHISSPHDFRDLCSGSACTTLLIVLRQDLGSHVKCQIKFVRITTTCTNNTTSTPGEAFSHQ